MSYGCAYSYGLGAMVYPDCLTSNRKRLGRVVYRSILPNFTDSAGYYNFAQTYVVYQ